MKRQKLQRDFQDCGVSCLSYLIEFYHGYVPIETLREDTFTSVHGTNAYHLVNSLKKYHFDAYGMRIENAFLSKLPVPFIAHLSLENGLQHFVVVNKVYKNKIEVMDPAKGCYKENLENFFKVFDQVVIVASPYQRIPKLPKEHALIQFFLKIFHENRKEFFWTFFLELLFFLLQMVNQFYVKVMVQNQHFNRFFLFTGCFLAFCFFQYLFFYEKEKLKLVIEKKVDLYSLREFLFHLMKLPMKKYQTYHEAEILKRVEESEELKNLFSSLCITFGFELFFSILSFFFLLLLNRILGLLVLLGIGMYFFIQWVFSSKISAQMRGHIENETNWKSATLEYIKTLVSARHAHAQDYLLNKTTLSLVETVKTRQKIQKKLLRIEWIKSFYLQFFLFSFFACGVFLLYEKQFSLIDFLTIQNLLFYLIRPVQSLGEYLPRISYYQTIYSKINEYLSIKEETSPVLEDISFSSLRVEDLTFSYYGNRPVFQSLCFQVDSFEHVFLKGKSGSGKSTLCKILMGEVDGYEGIIWFDEYPISELHFQDITSNIAYLSQREHLFWGTIRENILFGKEVEESRFLKVCQICHVDEIVRNKKLSYDSTILEGTLSCGEQERVLLARILLRDTSIYVLDEALGNVEEEMEKDIILNMRNYLHEHTLLYISHRKVEHLFDRVVSLS